MRSAVAKSEFRRQAGQRKGTAQSGNDSNCTISVASPVETVAPDTGQRVMISDIFARSRRALSLDLSPDLHPDPFALGVALAAKLRSLLRDDPTRGSSVPRPTEACVDIDGLVCRDPHLPTSLLAPKPRR